MVRQLQAFHHPAVDQVFVDDFVNIGLVHIGVPDRFRVDHQHRAFAAALQTAGFLKRTLPGPARPMDLMRPLAWSSASLAPALQQLSPSAR